DGPPVLPEALQCAERPAETLSEKRDKTVGRLGVSESRAVCLDPPADSPDPPRQIHILGHRVGRIATSLSDGQATPRADRAGNDGHCIDGGVRAASQILA